MVNEHVMPQTNYLWVNARPALTPGPSPRIGRGAGGEGELVQRHLTTVHNERNHPAIRLLGKVCYNQSLFFRLS